MRPTAFSKAGNRKRWGRWSVFLLLGLAARLYFWLRRPPIRFEVRNYRLSPPGWTIAKPLRLAVIADPHLNRPFTPPEHMAPVARRAMAEKPDVILLLGDYLSAIPMTQPSLTYTEIAAAFADLRAPLGVYAILGNHDWWEDHDPNVRQGHGRPHIAVALEEIGIPVLENSAVALEHGDERFWIAGLGDQRAVRTAARTFIGKDDLDRTLKMIGDDAPAILLAHEPDIFPQVPGRFSLTLSGHTHGGQIVLFGWAPDVPSKYGQRYLQGHIVEQGRHLIVSAGLGYSGLPVRVNAMAELVIVDLVP